VTYILHEFFAKLFFALLGWDGVAAAVLLAFGMWCGHYAARGWRSRPGELVILIPMTVASFVGAVLVCESVPKLAALLTVATFTYYLYVRAQDARRPLE
jgi:hypothetical protein